MSVGVQVLSMLSVGVCYTKSMTTETHPQATAQQLATEVLGWTEAEVRVHGGITVTPQGDIVLTNAVARRILAIATRQQDPKDK